ncbi:hypothetical protein GXM_01422 [Nostoc sphaeroides CCNUC1]|uniref:Uncharacterized protein n=1 Tax=Nostoc sphaeroides CCNUC1 TaxID=2653204 RepID=A0A5P8VVJ9_9NOSO|nr:hypothetical protein GXM_01422 [Nostoc sphaeroides CCNUC1]
MGMINFELLGLAIASAKKCNFAAPIFIQIFYLKTNLYK